MKIHDLTLDGQNRVNSGITVPADRTGVEIYNNIITAMHDDGVSIEDSDVTLTGNNFFGNAYGINISDLDDGDDVVGDYPHNNQFFNNSTYGFYYDDSSNDPTIQAANNWWGCNGGPRSAGCTNATNSSSNIASMPFLKLALSASPTPIQIGETSTLTAFMTSSSGPVSPISGLPWFNPLPAIIRTGTNFGILVGNLHPDWNWDAKFLDHL